MWPSREQRASTLAFWRAARAARQPRHRFAESYAYARWPYGYIGSAIGERWYLRLLLPFFGLFLVRTFDRQSWGASYHGKVMPTEQARRLVEVHEPVDVRVPEQVIPTGTARQLVLSNPTKLVALDCPCRLSRRNPCLPLDVCLIVGDPFASFVLAHQPRRARAITADEAVGILEGEAARGHVHHAFFKEAMLDRFYAICNCCTCCCGAMSAHRNGTPMLISSGYVAQVDAARCRGCGECASRCQFAAIVVAEHALPDASVCMGCGVCVRTCRNGALTLVRDATKPAPLEVPAG